jgi:hypothetical protein
MMGSSSLILDEQGADPAHHGQNQQRVSEISIAEPDRTVTRLHGASDVQGLLGADHLQSSLQKKG